MKESEVKTIASMEPELSITLKNDVIVHISRLIEEAISEDVPNEVIAMSVIAFYIADLCGLCGGKSIQICNGDGEVMIRAMTTESKSNGDKNSFHSAKFPIKKTLIQ